LTLPDDKQTDRRILIRPCESWTDTNQEYNHATHHIGGERSILFQKTPSEVLEYISRARAHDMSVEYEQNKENDFELYKPETIAAKAPVQGSVRFGPCLTFKQAEAIVQAQQKSRGHAVKVKTNPTVVKTRSVVDCVPTHFHTSKMHRLQSKLLPSDASVDPTELESPMSSQGGLSVFC
jgi:hypothetical protein